MTSRSAPDSYWNIWHHLKKTQVAYVAAPPARFRQIRKAICRAKYRDLVWHMEQDLRPSKLVLHFEERAKDSLLIVFLTNKTDWNIL